MRVPLKVGVTNIPNQVILGENRAPIGFSIDIFHKIEKELGIEFDYIPFQTWSQLIEAVKADKIDIVFLAQKTQDRLSYLDFTDAILSQQNKIIIKNNATMIETIRQLDGKKIASVKDSATYTYLKDTYPKIILVPVTTELDALKAVASDKADATICEPVRASYYMGAFNIKNLMVGGD